MILKSDKKNDIDVLLILLIQGIMTEEEKEELYEQFLTELITDLRAEVERDGGYWTINKAIDSRLEIIKQDIKDKI